MLVKFMVKATGVIVEKRIPSYDKAMSFVQKLRHSKSLVLMSFCELVECQ